MVSVMSRNDRAAYQLHSCQASVDSRPTDGNDREHFLPYKLSLTGSAPDAADAGQLGVAARDTRASAAAAVGFRRSRRLFRVAAVASISSWPLAFVLTEVLGRARAVAGCWRATEPAGISSMTSYRKHPKKPFLLALNGSCSHSLTFRRIASDAYRPDGYRTDSNGTSISHLRQ